MNTRLRRGVKHLRELGPLSVMRWGLVRAEAAAWERYFAVDTKRPFDREVCADNPEGIPYEPVPWCLARAAMDVLPMSTGDVFLDYGCGMGRVLLMAARRELKRVIGVESLPALARLAQQNVAAAISRLRSPVELVVADASTWAVPDDVTVAFLFNPLVGAAAAQRALAASLRRKHRHLRILYAHAHDQPNLFKDCPWLRLEKHVGVGVFEGVNVLLYENRATDEWLGGPTDLPTPLGGFISEGWLKE